MRILPEICANTLWPDESSTRNIAFGRTSTTVPSTSMTSFLAIRHPGGPGGGGGDHRPELFVGKRWAGGEALDQRGEARPQLEVFHVLSLGVRDASVAAV